MYQIAVDAGKFAVKSYDGKTTKYFLNRFVETEDLDSKVLVKFEGKYYTIDESSENIDYKITKTNLSTLLSILYAIHLYDPYSAYINVNKLFILCPLAQFFNYTEKNTLKQMVKGTFDVSVNHISHRIYIEKVYTMPETIGVLRDDIDEDYVGVIDIGGLNINGVVYINNKIKQDSAFTINRGSMMIYSTIRDYLTKKYGIDVQLYEIPILIKQNKMFKEDINMIITKEYDKIMTECKKRNWNIDIMPIYLTGGGSFLFDHIIISNKVYVATDGVFNNVIASYQVGENL